MKTIITEKSLVPVSLVTFLLGGSAWLTTIYVSGNANASAIQELKAAVADNEKQTMDYRRATEVSLEKIQSDVSFIRGVLDTRRRSK